jgi:hypothetical protein
MAELDINGPIDFSVWERNKRLYERLVKEGLVVIPILLDTNNPSISLIDHLIVSVAPPSTLNSSGSTDNDQTWRHSSSN